ncbi:Hypothetical predicted protein [Podarcis lilfordi]|uniref:Uncharacterized protein n=1 Tax=Podarcis lilfordi TaxID=74358 RepID=A0AA35P7Z4_9SAUR|nr:Hypothetical predicted protein [Podarcis lilfordi]
MLAIESQQLSQEARRGIIETAVQQRLESCSSPKGLVPAVAHAFCFWMQPLRNTTILGLNEIEESEKDTMYALLNALRRFTKSSSTVIVTAS